MFFGMQCKRSGVLTAVISFLMGTIVLPAFAEEEMTIDDYINAASPNLHNSCESAWAASGEDAEKYVAMINSFVAIIFINHDFNVQRIADAPEEDQEKLKVLFYNEIGKRCAEDPQKLLAGVVERSLVFAFDQMK
jgi:hypothetical protein